MKVKNASQPPQRYFGLHMVEGTAEYRDQGSEPYRIYIGEEVLKEMDKTFECKPVFVDHRDEVDFTKPEESDGTVIRSFYNTCDGKHWVEFIISSDEAHSAIRKGWSLSNAYIPKSFIGGGHCHGVEFQKEVTMAEYEHLAIVQNPRYQESIILTPEEFRAYNLEKEAELLKVANSIKGEITMKYNFFKRAKVENAIDVEGMSVTLPLSKTDKTVSECVEIADKFLNMAGYANGDHMVKVGEEEMSVNDLVDCYGKMKSSIEEEASKKNAEDEDKKKKENMTDEEKAAEAKKNAEKEGDMQKKKEKESDLATKKVEDSKKNEEEEKKKKENEEKEMEEKKKNSLYFDALKNAPHTAIKDEPKFEMAEDQVSRGKARYGSK